MAKKKKNRTLAGIYETKWRVTCMDAMKEGEEEPEGEEMAVKIHTNLVAWRYFSTLDWTLML